MISEEKFILGDELKKSTAMTITLKMAAEALGCDPRTVSAAAADGTIPSIRLGKRIVIPREKFLKLFEVEDA